MAWAGIKKKSSASCAAVLLFLLGGCAREQPVYRSEFLAMGTTVSISVAGGEPQGVAYAMNEAEQLSRRLGYEWYPWTADGGGELAGLNTALAQGRSAQVSPELADLLERTRELFMAGDGYFDPAVAPMVKRWGFDSANRPAQTPLPGDAEIAGWVSRHPSFADLRISGWRVSSNSTDLQLDLGAIGKGRVVDLATAALRKHGVGNALIDAGGNLRAIGRTANRAWRIAIRDPRGDQPLAWIDLNEDESASTSGDYERYAQVGDRRVHHILDPHTGMPVAHTMAVTVLAGDGTTADAASTAIMAAGPRHWLKIAKQMRLRYVLRVSENGDIEMSSGLRSRLHFSATVLQQHKLSVVEL